MLFILFIIYIALKIVGGDVFPLYRILPTWTHVYICLNRRCISCTSLYSKTRIRWRCNLGTYIGTRKKPKEMWKAHGFHRFSCWRSNSRVFFFPSNSESFRRTYICYGRIADDHLENTYHILSGLASCLRMASASFQSHHDENLSFNIARVASMWANGDGKVHGCRTASIEDGSSVNVINVVFDIGMGSTYK